MEQTDAEYVVEQILESSTPSHGSRETVALAVPTAGRGRTLRYTSSGGDVVTSLLTIRNQIKLYHWQTGSFSRHKTTDDLVSTLDDKIDTFIETFMGTYGRPKVKGSIKLYNFSEEDARKFVAKQETYLTTVLPRKLKKKDVDLLAIRDEILAELHKVNFLFTLA